MFKRKGLEISVLRTEGIDVSPHNLGCHVFINNELIDVISPLDSQQDELITDVPFTGSLSLIVKHLENQDIMYGQVNLKIEALPRDGFQWIPLYQEDIEILQMPQVVTEPKVLLLVNTIRELSPVQEITECSNDDEIENTDTSKISYSVSSTKVLKKEESQSDLLQIEKKFYIDKMEEYKQQYDQLIEKWYTRENELLTEIKNKEKEIVALQGSIEQAESKKKYYKSQASTQEVEQLMQQVQTLSEKNDNLERQVSDLLEKNELFKQKYYKEKGKNEVLQQNILDKDKENSKLYKSISQKNSKREYSQSKNNQIYALQEQIQKLQQENLEIKSFQQTFSKTFDCHIKPENSIDQIDSLDSTLQSLLGPKCYKNWFKKIKPGIYEVQGDKVHISFKNNQIHCRRGEQISNLKQFVEKILQEQDIQVPPALKLTEFGKSQSRKSPFHRRTNTMPECMNNFTQENGQFIVSYDINDKRQMRQSQKRFLLQTVSSSNKTVSKNNTPPPNKRHTQVKVLKTSSRPNTERRSSLSSSQSRYV